MKVSLFQTRINATALQPFQAHLQGELIDPSDECYDSAHCIWNGAIDKHPALIVHCATVSETIQEIIDAGLVRLLMPRRWGGYEFPFDVLVDSAIEIAKADASAGWCYSFLVSHGWLLAHFPDYEILDTWFAEFAMIREKRKHWCKIT